MSAYFQDGILWAVTLIGLGVAGTSIPVLLQQVKDAAIAPPPPPSPPSKRLQRDSENSLKLDNLRTLADGHSYELRNSVIKIVARRAVKTRTKQLLLQDLASSEEDRRDNAIQGLRLLLFNPALNDTKISSEFTDYATMHALITALVNVLPLHKQRPKGSGEDGPEDPKRLHLSPIRPANRPAPEVRLLDMLHHLLHHQRSSWSGDRITQKDNLATALAAGLVTRWLSHYPFPCALPENAHFNYKKSDVANLFDRKAWASDDPIMSDIVNVVLHSATGLKQMREAGLRASSYKEKVENRASWESPPWMSRRWSVEDSDVRMTGGEDTAGIPLETAWQPFTGDGDAPPRPRSQERSHEEESLRRRHREAIVVAERGAPLGRENILQRENSRVPLAPMTSGHVSDDFLADFSPLPSTDGDGSSSADAMDRLARAEARRGEHPNEMDRGADHAERERVRLQRENEIRSIQALLQGVNYDPEQFRSLIDTVRSRWQETSGSADDHSDRPR